MLQNKIFLNAAINKITKIIKFYKINFRETSSASAVRVNLSWTDQN